MTSSPASAPATLRPTRNVPYDVVRAVAIVVAGAVAIAVAARISVPVWPVPVTLQTLAVATVAALAGSRLGVAVVLTYLGAGLVGLPAFASGGGPAYFAGPTAGFLIGFVPMAYVIGRVAEASGRTRPIALIATMLLADAMLMGIGFAWLLAMAGSADWIDKAAPLQSAWRVAVEPFLLWDALKMAFAGVLVWQLSTRSHRASHTGPSAASQK
jgi:biotin transport system substrate-specific component